jgi:hypothetical protein
MESPDEDRGQVICCLLQITRRRTIDQRTSLSVLLSFDGV